MVDNSVIEINIQITKLSKSIINSYFRLFVSCACMVEVDLCIRIALRVKNDSLEPNSTLYNRPDADTNRSIDPKRHAQLHRTIEY